MLSTLIILPIIGALIIYLSESIISNRNRLRIGIIIAGINLIISLLIWIKFDENTAQFQFVEDWGSLFYGGLGHIIIGIDGISLFFVILTTFLTIPIILTPPYKGESPITYIIIILILESMLIAVFVVLDILLFYICFETVLIPMFLIIGIWGSRERKIIAAYQLFLYTLLGSLFMLLGILIIYYQTGTTDYQYLLSTLKSCKKVPCNSECILWLAFFLSFAVKVPMFPFHIWLYSAHSEAPTGGSMILAGILLKLAGFGFIRYSLTLFPNASEFFSPFVFCLAIIGIIYSILACIRQIDLKTIIAYSSISHMNIITLGIFSNTVIGIEGAIFMMISHGIVSSALFYCIGLLYDRTGTRILKYYRGLAITMPLFSLAIFILLLANMAVPGTIGFIGELLSFIGIFKTNQIVLGLSSISIILGAAYNIWLANRLLFGNVSKYITSFNDLTRREFIILFTFVFLTIFLGIFPNIILEPLHICVSSLI